MFPLCSSNTENPLQPVYERPPPSYLAEHIIKMLLNPHIDRQKVCQKIPVNVTESSTYMIDVTALKHLDDIKKDCFGVWTYSGSHTTSFHVKVLEDGHVNVEKCARGATGGDVYHLRRLHSVHPSNPTCKRLIALVSGKE